MKKDRVRDYATAAFRDYALYGLAPQEKPLTNTQTADIYAVHKTLEYFESTSRSYVVSAVKAVYFAGADKPIRTRNISERVSQFAVNCPADESTVYRWLKEARSKFADFRGLTH